jgi:hypothetical protein
LVRELDDNIPDDGVLVAVAGEPEIGAVVKELAVENTIARREISM